MPLTPHGQRMLRRLQDRYGAEGGKRVFYAMENQQRQGKRKGKKLTKDEPEELVLSTWIEKHGHHDQSTHGNWAGKKGKGGVRTPAAPYAYAEAPGKRFAAAEKKKKRKQQARWEAEARARVSSRKKAAKKKAAKKKAAKSRVGWTSYGGFRPGMSMSEMMGM